MLSQTTLNHEIGGDYESNWEIQIIFVNFKTIPQYLLTVPAVKYTIYLNLFLFIKFVLGYFTFCIF